MKIKSCHIKERSNLPKPEVNKILEFDEFLAAKGYSEKRRLVYLLVLPRLRKLLGKNFRAASKADIIRFMTKIEDMRLEE
jgi:hypothetical protein